MKFGLERVIIRVWPLGSVPLSGFSHTYAKHTFVSILNDCALVKALFFYNWRAVSCNRVLVLLLNMWRCRNRNVVLRYNIHDRITDCDSFDARISLDFSDNPPPPQVFVFNDKERDGAITVLQMVNAGAKEVSVRLNVCGLESWKVKRPRSELCCCASKRKKK